MDDERMETTGKEKYNPYDASEQYTKDAYDIGQGGEAFDNKAKEGIEKFYEKSGTTYGELAEKNPMTPKIIGRPPCPPNCVEVDVKGLVPQPRKAKEYFQSLLVNRGCSGRYLLWGYSRFDTQYHNFKFGKFGMCPICKVVHDNYNFDYKVKEGVYGGWKCWKTGEWETHYVFGMVDELIKK